MATTKALVTITITGPQGSGKTMIANAIREILTDADILVATDEDFATTGPGDAFEEMICADLQTRVLIKSGEPQ